MFWTHRSPICRYTVLCLSLCLAGTAGCGTSKLSNTSRTATEQLLLSDAMDRAVSQVNFSILSGKKVFIKSTAIESVTDYQYLLSLIRQHTLASGCLLQETEEEADIILELRAGTSGTDQHDTMFGISEMTIPGFGYFTTTTLPEVAIAKKTVQKATVKIGIFAYTREGRRPVWQSGNTIAESRSKSRWIFGMGPYQTGDIYEEAVFDDTAIPLIDVDSEEKPFVSVGSQAFFRKNLDEEKKKTEEEIIEDVVQETSEKETEETKEDTPDVVLGNDPEPEPPVSQLPPPTAASYGVLNPAPIFQ
ncbi:MAG: hypothetical protein IJD43_12405 [Thermoguttaceae bacterium]|nr:hypothetical protein [Thermoguttaceae bacterium]